MNAWILRQELKNAFILANLRDSVPPGLMHSTVSQHSRHSCQLSFYCVPWKLSFAGPVMYSKLHLQPNDKSTLCCAWRIAVKMKIHRGMLLCQEQGHFKFSPSPLKVMVKWPFCLRSSCEAFFLLFISIKACFTLGFDRFLDCFVPLLCLKAAWLRCESRITNRSSSCSVSTISTICCARMA